MSADLLYAATRKFNSFVRVRDGVRLSAEPGNLTNQANFKASGLVNAKVVGISAAGPNAVAISLKTKNGSKKPLTGTRKITLKTTSAKHASKVVEQLVDKEFYRRDLKRAALARVSKVIQAQQRANKMKSGSLKVVYGRNSRDTGKASKNKAFDFNQKTANKKKGKTLSANEAMDIEEQELMAQGRTVQSSAPVEEEEEEAPPALDVDSDEIPAPA